MNRYSTFAAALYGALLAGCASAPPPPAPMTAEQRADMNLQMENMKLNMAAIVLGGADAVKQARVSPSRPAEPAPKVYHSDVDVPAYSAPEDEDDVAVVVGIEKYAALPEAEFAERDARAVRDHLIALGYPRRNIAFLAGQQAGKAGLEKTIESWLPNQVRETSRVFVYFSGHGAPDPGNGLAYLVPWDGDAKYLESTGYPVKRLYEKLNALKARQIVVAMDSCFSGAGGRSVLAKGLRPLVTKLDAGTQVMGRTVVLAASGPDEVTGTAHDQGHGLFTYYLLRGLNAEKGKGTVQELFGYLLPKVRDGARDDNREQTPQLLPAGSSAAARWSLGNP